MAQRRMLSKQITETDSFMDMSLSAQALYLHLAMNADDDGFVGNAKTILRMVGASNDDFKILIAKQFILVMEMDDGIIVIRDWKIHNYIQKDRYHKTIYQNYYKKLETDENGSYVRVGDMYPTRIQSVYKMDTQDRIEIGKDRLGKVRLDNDNNKKDLSSLFSKYQSLNQLKPSQNVQDQLKNWFNKLTENGSTESEKLIIKAMEISHEKGKHNMEFWKVTVGILKNWLNEQTLTVEQVTKLDKQTASVKTRKIIEKETLPDWAKSNQSTSTPDSKVSSKVSNETVEKLFTEMRAKNEAKEVKMPK